MATHDRAKRVAHEFQRELSALLARGLKDPRITGFITVTGAKMGPDLKDVTVYVSIHGDERTREQTLEGLRAAAGYLQREVARHLGMRYTPHLRFAYDRSVAEGDKIERLLKEVKDKEGWTSSVQPERSPGGAPTDSGPPRGPTVGASGTSGSSAHPERNAEGAGSSAHPERSAESAKSRGDSDQDPDL
jgi:ribosome-binding factor A